MSLIPEDVPPELQGPVGHWRGGSLFGTWVRRWVSFGGGVVRLFERRPKPGDQPVLEVNLAAQGVRALPDATNPERMRLDDSVGIVHLKFEDAAHCSVFIRACETARRTSVEERLRMTGIPDPTVPEFDDTRWQLRLGKYWFGNRDRTRTDPAGGFGSVMTGVNSETGERVACKTMHARWEGTEAQRQEIALQASLQHANIVDLVDVVQEVTASGESRTRMIMEMMGGGELFADAIDHNGLSEDRARHMFRQVFMGITYLHNRRLIHRDNPRWVRCRRCQTLPQHAGPSASANDR